jgi:hypothetical protein
MSRPGRSAGTHDDVGRAGRLGRGTGRRDGQSGGLALPDPPASGQGSIRRRVDARASTASRVKGRGAVRPAIQSSMRSL